MSLKAPSQNILIYADSEKSADMLYACGIFVPDPFIYFTSNGRSFMVVGDLEIDRARATAKADEILPLAKIQDRLKRIKKIKNAGPADVIAYLLRQRKLREIHVPPDFPLRLAEQLNEQDIWLVSTDKLFPEREFKSALEVKAVEGALRMTEAGLKAGIDLIRNAQIVRKSLTFEGKKLTSERVRAEIDATIIRLGGLPAHTIVAGGNQACDPHERGFGVLRPHETIILDIFPREQKSGYFGDMTRTVVRGKASEKVKKMYQTVFEGQQMALRKMRPGADGRQIHDEIKEYFTRQGFPTGIKKGRQSGFFHGTGHGVGLEIHESPRFGLTTFKPGQVITVEPGLYYWGVGGVRIEDIALVTSKGNRLLSDFPYQLEI